MQFDGGVIHAAASASVGAGMWTRFTRAADARQFCQAWLALQCRSLPQVRVGAVLWRYDEVRPHWDRLVLRSFVSDGGGRRLYQEGPVTNMRSPEDLIRRYTGGDALALGTAMFCGTFAVHGGISTGGRFDMELSDPMLGRTLAHGYNIVSLPDEG